MDARAVQTMSDGGLQSGSKGPAGSNHGERRVRRRPRSRRLIEHAVAQVFGVAASDLDVPRRGRKRVALARQVAMYVTHVSCGLSMTDVGTLFTRDRTTVAHACGVVEDKRDDPIFDRVIELLEWIVPALLCSRYLTRRA